jgi:hypothetical protein
MHEVGICLGYSDGPFNQGGCYRYGGIHEHYCGHHGHNIFVTVIHQCYYCLCCSDLHCGC